MFHMHLHSLKVILYDVFVFQHFDYDRLCEGKCRIFQLWLPVSVEKLLKFKDFDFVFLN